MTTPDNARLLASERAAFESEQAAARDEQALWLRLETALAETTEPRNASLAARLSSLAGMPDAPPSLIADAQALATKRHPAEDVPAARERESALAARQAALQTRLLAAQSMARGVAALEGARAARTRELDELEHLLQRIETETQRAEAARVAAQQNAAREAAQTAANEAALKRAQEEAALQARLAQEKAQTLATSPSVPVFDPNVTAPGVPAFRAPDEARTVIEMPAMVAAPVAPPPVVVASAAPQPVVAASPVSPPPAATASFSAASLPLQASVSQPPAAARKPVARRRRRVRLAPPPRKLHVEVAEHGEDTFYTGWNEKISDGGLFVVSLETLPPGHELDVEVQVEGKTISSRGKVQFIRKDNIANPECASGAGIKLLNLSAENASTIESFFAKRAPLFFVQP